METTNHLMVVVLLTARADWINHGGDLYNRIFSETEVKISPATVSRLKLKWKFFAGRDITATPAVSEGIVYFPCWNGNINAVSSENGSPVWEKNLEKLTGLKGTGFVKNVNVSVWRATPTIVGNLLIIGIYGPATVIGVERATGNLVWSSLLDSHARAVITMSGTVYEGGFYVGTSSLEEILTIEECCTFRGSMVRLDVGIGKIVWQTFMLPDNGGKLGEYSGAAIWGSSPAIDINRKLVYVATGNLYTAPQYVVECQEKQNNKTVPDSPDPPITPDNHEESILALDMVAGPGSPGGGGNWGAATDGQRVYTNIVNSRWASFTLTPSGAVTSAGAWVALDAKTGKVLWSTANPSNTTSNGPVTVANGVLFGGSVVGQGPIYALDAATGNILWSLNTGATVYGGVSVSNGCVYLGNGYRVAAGGGRSEWTSGISLYAFCIS